jgi:hypothetical protein
MRKRYYGLRNIKRIEKIKYIKGKTKYWIMSYLTINKIKRESYKRFYMANFINNQHITCDNSIPKSKYYIPIAIISNELIEKENIPLFKLGLEKLITKQLTHKFIGHVLSHKDIEDLVEYLNEDITSFSSLVDCGRYDFENDEEIKKYVEYLDVYVRNYSTSYFVLEIHIYLTDYIKNIMINKINSNYVSKRAIIIQSYGFSKDKSGAKKSVNCYWNNDAYLKSEIINDILLEIKWLIFNKLEKYFPLVFNSNKVMPPSINIYKTDILFSKDEYCSFLRSVGIDNIKACSVSKNSRIFFETEIGCSMYNNRADMIFVINDSEEDLKSDYVEEIISNFINEYDAFYKLYILDIINHWYTSVYANYRNIINRIKIKRTNYRKLLKLRYQFEFDFKLFNKIYNELDFDCEIKNAESFFDNEYSKLDKLQYYKSITTSLISNIKHIDKNRDKLEDDLNQKILITSHINDYYIERKSIRINFIMLSISSLTFILILYPNLATKITENIDKIINALF